MAGTKTFHTDLKELIKQRKVATRNTTLVLITPIKGCNLAKFTIDNLHPNDVGYKKISKVEENTKNILI